MNTYIPLTSRGLMTCKMAISCTINVGTGFAQCCIAFAIAKKLRTHSRSSKFNMPFDLVRDDIGNK